MNNPSFTVIPAGTDVVAHKYGEDACEEVTLALALVVAEGEMIDYDEETLRCTFEVQRRQGGDIYYVEVARDDTFVDHTGDHPRLSTELETRIALGELELLERGHIDARSVYDLAVPGKTAIRDGQTINAVIDRPRATGTGTVIVPVRENRSDRVFALPF